MWDLEQLKKLAAANRIARREAILLALKAGLTLAAAESMFVDAVAATPKQGGSPRFGLPQ